jgi:hypothetical protein
MSKTRSSKKTNPPNSLPLFDNMLNIAKSTEVYKEWFSVCPKQNLTISQHCTKMYLLKSNVP